MPQALLDYLAPKKILLLASAERGAPLINIFAATFRKKSFLLQIKTR